MAGEAISVARMREAGSVDDPGLWLRHRGGAARLYRAKHGASWELEDGSLLHDGSGGTLIHSLTGLEPPPPECFRNISPSSGFETPRQAALHNKIKDDYLPGGYSLAWTSSGSDALELAVWFLSRPHRDAASPTRFFVAEGGYHGATMLLQQLSTRAGPPSAPVLGEVTKAVIPSFRAAKGDELAARIEAWLDSMEIGGADMIVLETIPTTGARFSPDLEGLDRLIRFAQARGASVLLDEVASGAFRHGWFSSLSHGLRPDGLVLSKGLTCGAAACSAVIVRDDLVDHVRRQGGSVPGYTVTLNDVTAHLIGQALGRYEALAGDGWFSRRAAACQALAASASASAPSFSYEATSTTLRISTRERADFSRLVSSLAGVNLYLYASSAAIEGIPHFFALYCPAFDQADTALAEFDRLLLSALSEAAA